MPALRNIRQERVAQNYVQHGNRAKAYREAGYVDDRSNAHRMTTSDNVETRVQEILDSGAHKAVSADMVIGGLAEIATDKADMAPGARVKAYELLGKTEAGGRAFKDQIETTTAPVDVTVQLDSMSDEQKRDLAQMLLDSCDNEGIIEAQPQPVEGSSD